MELRKQKSQFRLSYGFHMSVDFCLWILEQDGLQVSPFDVHPNWNGELQASGFQAIEWQQWFSQVVIHPDQNPTTLWMGSSHITSLLEQKWRDYQPLSDERRSWEAPLGIVWAYELPSLWPEIWQQCLLTGHCDIALVSYPKPVEYVVPPYSAVVSIPYGYLDSHAFNDILQRIIRTLFPSEKKDGISIKDQAVQPPTFPSDDVLRKDPRFQAQQRVIDEFLQKGPGSVKIGRIQSLTSSGAIVNIDGMEVDIPTTHFMMRADESIMPGQQVEVHARRIDQESKQVLLDFKLL